MNRIRKIIRESIDKLLDEDALRFSNLPDGTGLFIKNINAGYDMTLYNPKNKNAYAHIVIVLRGEADDYFVSGVAAERGFGPFIYELAMMHIDKEGKGLMPTRDGSIRGEAWNIWEYFYKFREDVEKRELDVLNYAYNFNIIDDINWYDDNEKMEIYNELSDSDREELKIFNAAFFMKPSEEYFKLIKNAETWESKGFDADKAEKAGDELWDYMYNK